METLRICAYPDMTFTVGSIDAEFIQENTLPSGSEFGTFCTVDEIIFRTTNIRNRLMLELMARRRMKVGEVLNLTPAGYSREKPGYLGKVND